MEQTLEFTRGDTYKFKFKRVDKDGNVIDHVPQKLYFTVKESHLKDDIVFQKTLEDGIVYDPSDQYYHVQIENRDTDGLPYYTYVFDIEVVEEEYTQTIASGILKLKRETTFVGNEV